MWQPRGSYQIIVLVYLMMEDRGSAERPVVTFTPDCKKILIGERITMACNVEPASPTCSWYQNNNPVYTGETYVIPSAEMGHGGDYHCQTGDGERSEIVTLNVTDGPVILQAPLYVYEGDDVSLRCHSSLEYPSSQSIFYRNNRRIQATDSDLLPIKYTDLTDTYNCSKQVLTTTNNTYSDETTISYTDTEKDSVIFTPDWNKLLTGENITMTFNKGSGIKYLWYQDKNKVNEERSYTIPSAQAGHSGTYRCRTSYGNSDEFRLHVTDGPVILQAPVLVYWGNDLPLRCHSPPGYKVIRTTFYKDGEVIKPSRRDPGLVIIPRDRKQEGRYRCERTLSRDEYVTYTDEESLHVRELFPKPNISTELPPGVEGDHMTLTCNTSLRPHRARTRLEFSFYRDGGNVQEFGSSNKYEVHSTQMEDSGNYSCDVRTPTGTVRKRSEELYIQIKEYPNNITTAIVAGLVSTTLLIILILGIVLLKKKLTCDEKRPTTGNQEAASPGGASEQADVFYTDIKITQKVPATSSAPEEDSCYVNYTANQTTSLPKVTETQVVYSVLKPRTDP